MAYEFTPLSGFEEFPPDELARRSEDFLHLMKRRRTVRQFSNREVPRKVIENCLLAAGRAPNGANMQPWQFVVVSNADTKRQIREAAEKVEREFYSRRAPQYWLDALAPLGTDENKPFLEDAPYLIAVFSKRHTVLDDGSIKKHYYISESVGIAIGILITALHYSGLVCLTHTPNPMAFLRDLLQRPKEETPYLLLATGYPGENATVPKITKKPLDDIATFLE